MQKQNKEEGMDDKKLYEEWLTSPVFDEATKAGMQKRLKNVPIVILLQDSSLISLTVTHRYMITTPM